jgi:hypothetical protein
LNAAQLGTWDWDSDEIGRVVSETRRMFGVPDGASRSPGRSHSSCIGRSVGVLVPSHAVEHAAPLEVEFRVTGLTSLRWVMNKGKILWDEAVVSALISVNVDMTDRKRAGIEASSIVGVAHLGQVALVGVVRCARSRVNQPAAILTNTGGAAVPFHDPRIWSRCTRFSMPSS